MVQADAGAVLEALLEVLGEDGRAGQTAWARRWGEAGRLARTVLDERLAAETTMFEGKVAAEVAARLPADAVLHVGNSMPVRDLDTFAGIRTAALRVDGNRGANGIDGVVSSALGAAAVSDRPTVLV